ncbi:tumor necrosis factor receptor superfamily member 5 [Aulostomus maculatus]
MMTMTTTMVMMMMMMGSLLVRTWAQHHCDPLTQYEDGDQCCRKCPPGTSMTSPASCQNPTCKDCGEDEYQEGYTTQTKCERQPYCDPNKNFQDAEQKSKTEESICQCKAGFHCSSDACLTCVPHRVCGPGWMAQSKGNQTHDTVCQRCPEGTFSNDSSPDAVCKKWSECKSGYRIKHGGTGDSDSVCERTPQHVGLIVGVCLLVLVLVVLGIMIFVLKAYKGDSQGDLKDCVGLCVGRNKTPPVALITDAPVADQAEEEFLKSKEQLSQEDSNTPEENEDPPSRSIVFSDRGNFVTEENGKSEILSWQETQTQTSSK